MLGRSMTGRSGRARATAGLFARGEGHSLLAGAGPEFSPESMIVGRIHAHRPSLSLTFGTPELFSAIGIAGACGRQAVTGPSCWNARARNRKSTILPSCGCNQFSLIVGIGP